VLQELCSSDRPLRESETLSECDGEDLGYLKRQHTPWCRCVHRLDHLMASHVSDQTASRRESDESQTSVVQDMETTVQSSGQQAFRQLE